MKEELIKYLNNKCSDEEYEEIVSWLKEKALTKEARNWAYEDWKSFSPELKIKDEKKYHALLDKIHHEINLNRNENISPRSIILTNTMSWLSKAAAILFIPLLGALLYVISQSNIQSERYVENLNDSIEIVAPIGSRAIVQLTDGTEVHLNYGSRIKYPRIFSGKTRDVRLEGEGYFDVAHYPDKPFIVKAGKVHVKALGTVFNVFAYHEDETISISLVEGKVVLEEKIAGKKKRSIGTMAPGQHVTYQTSTGKITASKGNLYKYVAWKEGKMVFDNESIEGVAAALGRKFNVEIELAENVKDFTYTVTFFNDPLFLILDLMAETTPITYKTLPRKKLADGSYTKLKIQIQRKE